MLRFTKETNIERINRLEESIITNYIQSDNKQDLLVSEADLVFLLEKAKQQINNENGLSQSYESNPSQTNVIDPIDLSHYGGIDDESEQQIF